MSKYDVSWTRLIRNNIWSAINQPKLKALLLAFINPISNLLNRFDLYRAYVDQELAITGQKRILQYWLNQNFDPDLQRIEVEDVEARQPVFIFLESENRPLYLPVFLSGRSVDFLVILPDGMQSSESSIRGFVDRYKLVTKRYRIIYE